MNGGSAALFASIVLAILEDDERRGLRALLPAYVAAVVLHSAFNDLRRESVVSVPLIQIAVLSSLMIGYHCCTRTLAQWLGRGFDAQSDPEAVEHLVELDDLGRGIGRAGLAALDALLPGRRRALRQLRAVLA